MASISVSLDRNADRHDVKLLKRELDTLPGVTSVSVSSGGQLAVDYDATGVRQADILERSRRWATTSGRNTHNKTGNRPKAGSRFVYVPLADSRGLEETPPPPPP